MKRHRMGQGAGSERVEWDTGFSEDAVERFRPALTEGNFQLTVDVAAGASPTTSRGRRPCSRACSMWPVSFFTVVKLMPGSTY